jgi:hypothetical protein
MASFSSAMVVLFQQQQQQQHAYVRVLYISCAIEFPPPLVSRLELIISNANSIDGLNRTSLFFSPCVTSKQADTRASKEPATTTRSTRTMLMLIRARVAASMWTPLLLLLLLEWATTAAFVLPRCGVSPHSRAAAAATGTPPILLSGYYPAAAARTTTTQQHQQHQQQLGQGRLGRWAPRVAMHATTAAADGNGNEEEKKGAVSAAAAIVAATTATTTTTSFAVPSSGVAMDIVLARQFPQLSRRACRRLLQEGHVFVDGKGAFLLGVQWLSFV